MKRRTNVPSPVDSLVTQVEQLQQTDSTVEDGEIIWCRATQCLWVYRQNSGLTPDGVQIVAALYGNGVWVRSSLTLGAGGAQFQTAWFIDPTNGSDANTGLTAATALKTDAERQRRWGDGTTLLLAPTTVTYLGTPPTTDVVNYDVSYANGSALTIVGTPTLTNPNVTLTAVQVLDRTVSPTVRWAITGVGLGVGDVARLVNINQGARAGNYALVLKDEGGGKVDVSPFGKIDIAQAATLAAGFTQVTPLIGDVVDVMTVPVLTVGAITVRAATPALFTAAPTNCVVLDNIQLDGTGGGANNVIGFLHILGGDVFVGRAVLRNLAVRGWGGFWQCGGGVLSLIRWEMMASINGGPFCNINGTGFAKGAGGGGVATCARGTSLFLDGDATFQDFSFFTFGDANVGRVGMYDRAAANLNFQVLEGGIGRMRSALVGVLLYGDNNAGVGVQVIGAGAMLYSTKPTINTSAGAGRQSIVGGTNKDWAAIPYVEPANNAMIVVYQ